MILDLSMIEFQINMLYEEKRLETFKKWVFEDDKACNAQKMAEAGFYFVGTSQEPDAVECFLCNKPLDGWDENDDPWEEHISHSSNCSFAKLRTPTCQLTELQRLGLMRELIIRLFEKSYEERKQLYSDKFANFQRELKSFKGK